MFCSYCVTAVDSSHLQAHVSAEHKTQTFQCASCPQLFNTRPEVLQHMERDHQTRARDAEKLIRNPEQLQGIICLRCQWQVVGDDLDTMEFHLKTVHNEQEILSEQEVLRHVQLFCRWCGKDKAFRSVEQLAGHIKDHTSRRSTAFINSINKTLTSRAVVDSRDRRHGDYRGGGERRYDDRRPGERGDWRRDDHHSRDRGHDDRGDMSRDREARDKRDSYGGRGDGCEARSEEWECSKCRSSNFADRRNCRKCREPNSSGGAGGRGRGFDHGGRGGGRDFDRGRGGRGGGRGRGGVRGGRGGARGGRGGGRDAGFRERLEDWTCLACGADNFGHRTQCFKCDLAKGEKKQEIVNYMEDSRSEIEKMMAELMEQRRAEQAQVREQHSDASEIVSMIINDIITLVTPDEQEEMDMDAVPDSPDYTPPSPAPRSQLGEPGLDHQDSINKRNTDQEEAASTPQITAPANTESSESDSEGVNKTGNDEAGTTFTAADTNNSKDELTPPDSPDYAPTDDFEDSDDEDSKARVSSMIINQDTRKKCKKCNHAFNEKFDVWDHLIAFHGVADDVTILEEFVLDINTPNVLLGVDTVEVADEEVTDEQASDTVYECSLCHLTHKIMFEVYEHLETVHKIGDSEEELMKHINQIPAPHNRDSAILNSNTTVEASAAATNNATDIVNDDDTEGSVNSERAPYTSRSTSPLFVQTVQELRDAIAKDDWNFVVQPEVQNTEEYKQFLEDYKKEHSVDFKQGESSKISSSAE